MLRLNAFIFKTSSFWRYHKGFTVPIEGVTKCFVSLKVVKFFIFSTRPKSHI